MRRFRELGLEAIDLLFAGWTLAGGMAVGAARGYGGSSREVVVRLLTVSLVYVGVLRALARLGVSLGWRDLFRVAGLGAGTTLVLSEAGAAAALAGGRTWERELAWVDGLVLGPLGVPSSDAAPGLVAAAMVLHLCLRVLPLVAIISLLWVRRDRATALAAGTAMIGACAVTWVLHLFLPARAPEIVAGLAGLEDVVPSARAVVAGAPWDAIARLLDGAGQATPDAFPSAGAAVTAVAVAASRRAGRAWAWGTGVVAVLGMVSAVFLGRHWILGLVAGLGLGLGAWFAASRRRPEEVAACG